MNLIEEIRSLDPKQPGNWPWPIKAGAMVVIFVVLQVAAYFLLWAQQKEQIEKGQAR